VFTAFGVLFGPLGLGLLDLQVDAELVGALAELTLALVLFTDASNANLRELKHSFRIPLRLLLIGLPLTILLGFVTGVLLFKGLNLLEIAVLATMLAPTDAALGKAVVTNKTVPSNIREGLNVESGLNDGLSIPFLFLFTGLAVSEAQTSATGWASFALEQIGFGALVGAAIGLWGGWLVERATARGWMTGTFQQLSMIGLALGAWALAEQFGGNGFIGAFVAGLTAGRITTVSVGDNLVKGAAGGAMQWMNRLFGQPDSAGLTGIPPGWT